MQDFPFKPEGNLLNTPENKQSLSSLINLEKAMAEKKILEAVPILCDRDKNLIFNLNGMEGVMEKSEAVFLKEPSKVKDIAIISRVNRPVAFQVIDILSENGKTRAILSRKRAQKQATEYFMNVLTPGLLLPARVTHLEPFGAFCDIGCGVISLIGIENISVSRISHAKDRFYKDQDIYAVVSSIDLENYRINLSHKELLGTWAENAKEFTIGETVTGIIRSVESYGIFTELSPNLSGLAEFKEGMKEGALVSVFIKNIIPEKNKIKLIIINSFGPAEVSDVTKYYKFSGDEVTHFNYF